MLLLWAQNACPIQRSIGDGDKEWKESLWSIQEANDMAIFLWNQWVFDGNQLKLTIVPVKGTKVITVPHSCERIIELSYATTHGGKFLSTKGSHIMTNTFFKLAEKANPVHNIDVMAQDRKYCQSQGKIEDEAKKILVEKEKILMNKYYTQLTNTQLNILLKWHDMQKGGNDNKEMKITKWKHIWGESHLATNVWEVNSGEQHEIKGIEDDEDWHDWDSNWSAGYEEEERGYFDSKKWIARKERI